MKSHKDKGPDKTGLVILIISGVAAICWAVGALWVGGEAGKW